jgi:hypothetical protein
MTLVERPEPPTRPGLLSEATHVVLPAGIVSTGFPATDATCRKIGIVFDPWQADLNKCLLAKDAAGLYAADTVALSIPRQVGKTFDVGGVVFADSIIHPGTTTVWTAHRFKVARESFNEMRGWATSSLLRQHIDPDEITTAAGNECIPFRNGSRIVFAARERGAIRGFTRVRRLVLDEAQILTEHALSDLAPTQNQAVNPQMIFMGTPPKPTDPGEVFNRLRTEALDGSSEGVLYVEFSAPKDADLDDRSAWRTANPSYPQRTPERAILRLRKLLSDDDFRREALGIWSDHHNQWRTIPEATWMDLVERHPQMPERLAFGVQVDYRRRCTAIAAAGFRPDGTVLVTMVAYQPGTEWVVSRLARLKEKHRPIAIAVQDKGPTGSLIDDMAKVEILPSADPERPLRGDLAVPWADDVADAFGKFVDAINQRRLFHTDDVPLNLAVADADTRQLSGALAWDFKGKTDCSPLLACTFAYWALVTRHELVAEDFTPSAHWL